MLRHKFSAVHIFGYWKKIGFQLDLQEIHWVKLKIPLVPSTELTHTQTWVFCKDSGPEIAGNSTAAECCRVANQFDSFDIKFNLSFLKTSGISLSELFQFASGVMLVPVDPNLEILRRPETRPVRDVRGVGICSFANRGALADHHGATRIRKQNGSTSEALDIHGYHVRRSMLTCLTIWIYMGYLSIVGWSTIPSQYSWWIGKPLLSQVPSREQFPTLLGVSAVLSGGSLRSLRLVICISII